MCEKVILYNFFEESAHDILWKDLIKEDSDKSKLRVPKYVPLIHEVSDTPYSRRHRPYLLTFEAQMFVCRHY